MNGICACVVGGCEVISWGSGSIRYICGYFDTLRKVVDLVYDYQFTFRCIYKPNSSTPCMPPVLLSSIVFPDHPAKKPQVSAVKKAQKADEQYKKKNTTEPRTKTLTTARINIPTIHDSSTLSMSS